jgi:hypothetical protein
MAFTYCTGCGEKIDTSNSFCPYCGVKNSQGDYSVGKETYGENTPPHEEPSHNQNNGSFNSQQNAGGFYQQPNGGFYQQPNGGFYQQPYGGFNNGNPYNPFFRVVQPQKRPISIGLLVFSIINIVLSCFVLPSFTFGIIALVYTIEAQSAKTAEEEIRKKKIALILNITGAVLSVLTIVSFSLLYADIIAEILTSQV